MVMFWADSHMLTVCSHVREGERQRERETERERDTRIHIRGGERQREKKKESALVFLPLLISRQILLCQVLHLS